MKFLTHKKLEGRIKLVSGLHIGGNKDTVEIGGIDNPVIKNPITGLPYIPGSSIKGKMRFLMEWKLGKIKDKNPHSCNDPACPVCRIFGNTDPNRSYGPTRLRISDCNLHLSEEEEIKLKKSELVFLEDKVENRINRLSGTAIDPRHIERVPAGLLFDFELIYKIFEIDEKDVAENVDKKNWDFVVEALYLLQNDSLGGSGSRGYGKIEFVGLKLNGDDLNWAGTHQTAKQPLFEG